MDGTEPRRTGNAHPNIYPYDALATGTDPVFVAVGNDRQFASLCRCIGLPELAEDPLYRSAGARSVHRDGLKQRLEAAMAAFDGRLIALDAATGAEQWSTYTGGQCGSATLTPEAAYVTTWGGTPTRYALTAVRRADGSTLWSVPPAQTDSLGFENPTLSGNSLYVSDRRSGVSAFDAGTGALRWKAETGMLNQQATVAGGLVYVSTWGNGSTAPHRVFAFSAKDGALKWSRPTDTANSQYPAAVAEGRVFVGSDTGALYAYDAAKGKPLWKATFSGYVSAPIVAAGPAVLVNTGT
eukprot:gene42458-56422_t